MSADQTPVDRRPLWLRQLADPHATVVAPTLPLSGFDLAPAAKIAAFRSEHPFVVLPESWTREQILAYMADFERHSAPRARARAIPPPPIPNEDLAAKGGDR